ncbi:MAG: SDR family NAD(P)-dependent oxidoreductase, partial [Acidobacteriota bacterium]|nr:SDR family NAD(P)-dependent oxidoreductase [Acidobacteriota bacterium]
MFTQNELTGQTALVTGAGGEIGGAIAAALLAAGANVVWLGRSKPRLKARARE